MAKNSVVWTETAIKQRREILKYWTIRNKSTEYAEKRIGLINERIKLIALNPEAVKPTNHLETRQNDSNNKIWKRRLKKQKRNLTPLKQCVKYVIKLVLK